MRSITSRSKRLFLVGIALAVSVPVATVVPAQYQAPDAERVARVYMKAFFAGDIKTAADLMDPRALERIRQAFLSELVNVGDADAEKAILANLGAKTTAEVSEVDAKTLFVAITEMDRRRNPQLSDAMTRARVEVLGSGPAPAGGVVVRFRVSTPIATGTSTQDSALLMRSVMGDWKVVGNVSP